MMFSDSEGDWFRSDVCCDGDKYRTQLNCAQYKLRLSFSIMLIGRLYGGGSSAVFVAKMEGNEP
jgi:hypothetical protein